MSDPTLHSPQSLLCRLEREAKQGYIRHSCWLTGSPEWTAEQVLTYLHRNDHLNSVVISSREWEGQTTCDIHQAHRLLGQEVDLLVYDGFSGINPDALGQVSGLLKGGGLFIFLSHHPESPDFYNDPEKQRLRVEPYASVDVADHFLNHLKRCFTEEASLSHFDQIQGMLSLSPFSIPRASEELMLFDQRRVVDQITQCFGLPGKRNCVLTAARGRGKSSALGILARQYLSQGRNVVVTAPSIDAVESVFKQASISPEALRERYRVDSANQASLVFKPPIDVLCDGSDADILLVDEAAGIPVQLLTGFLEQFTKIVFATTTQGYEGTGQGFALRFFPVLKRCSETLQSFTLEKPIRWSDHDPLEPFINKLLLLDSCARFDLPTRQEVQGTIHSIDTVQYRRIDGQRLVDDPDQLRSLFGLMINAHYRTTPGDLRIMLDSPNLQVWVAELAGDIIGACLVAEEGGLDDTLVQHIWEGRRRPRGHLIPQLLIAQEGYLDAADFTMLRVVRIAVKDEYRRLGVASALLAVIQKAGENSSYHLIGASFAVTPTLLDFWQAEGYQVVRIGTQRDPVSGSYATLVIKGLSTSANLALCVWESQFQKRFIYLQKEWLQDFDKTLLARVQRPVSVLDLRPESEEWKDLSGFAFHYRSYESSASIFARLAEKYRLLWDVGSTDTQIKKLIEGRVIQQKNELLMIQSGDLQNRKALLKSLRMAASFLFQQAKLAGKIK